MKVEINKNDMDCDRIEKETFMPPRISVEVFKYLQNEGWEIVSYSSYNPVTVCTDFIFKRIRVI